MTQSLLFWRNEEDSRASRVKADFLVIHQKVVLLKTLEDKKNVQCQQFFGTRKKNTSFVVLTEF